MGHVITSAVPYIPPPLPGLGIVVHIKQQSIVLPNLDVNSFDTALPTTHTHKIKRIPNRRDEGRNEVLLG